MKKIQIASAGLLCCYLISSSFAADRSGVSSFINPLDISQTPAFKTVVKRGNTDLIFKSSFDPLVQPELVAFTSFEEATIEGGKYFDAGDPDIAHDLVNNSGQPLIDLNPATELAVDARYEPFDTIGFEGLTDGDFVGANNFTGLPSDTDLTNLGPYPDGTQSYQMQDCDGNMILDFATVDLTGHINNTVSIEYYIRDTGYEGNGSINEEAHDRIRIYLKDLTNNSEIDILNTEGMNINVLGIVGEWMNGTVSVPDNVTVQLVVEMRSNAGRETIWLDDIKFIGTPN